MPTAFIRNAETSLVPDAYVTMLSPRDISLLGRGGGGRASKEGTNIVGLDIDAY